jgi:hypothetical protein
MPTILVPIEILTTKTLSDAGNQRSIIIAGADKDHSCDIAMTNAPNKLSQ